MTTPSTMMPMEMVVVMMMVHWRGGVEGNDGLIFCFTKPPVKGGFVRHNIDKQGRGKAQHPDVRT
jgi:hypothetical protein